jgi:N-acetylneuraminic acid mutarotase
MAWTAESPIPTASAGLAAAVCQAPPAGSGEWVYAVGGTNESNVLASLAGYDTAHKKWSALPSMPTARSGVAAATSPGRIHVLGGYSDTSETLTTHEVYEPANNAWSTAAPLPSGRALMAAVTGPDGLIYAIGGFVQNPVTTVEAYDPTTDVYLYNPADPGWISQPPMSSGRALLAATAGTDGLVYAIGGTDSNNALATVAAFTSDKCYPIEVKIAAVQSELSTVQGDLGDLPPQDRAAAERQMIAGPRAERP